MGVTDKICTNEGHDGLNSVRALSDMTGALTDTYSYDAYGVLLDSTGTSPNPYRYRGEQYDPALSAYYLRARYYQPGIGRFLTTDPVEGTVGKPLSAHRYMYGRVNPNEYLDPSGAITLPETLAITLGMGILANMSIGVIGHVYNDLYVGLAKEIYPEAYIIGVNATVTLPAALVEWFVSYLDGDLPFPSDFFDFESIETDWYAESVGGGWELVFSVGSGEIGIFETFSLAGAYSVNYGIGLELYDGAVFNLWNVDDYTGPFASAFVSMGNYGWTLFWDGPRKFEGPWGVGSTFFSKSFPLNIPWGVGKTNTNYEQIGKRTVHGRGDMYRMILTCLSVASIARDKTEKGMFRPLRIGLWLLESSTWANIARAHYFWNIKDKEYGMGARREIARPAGYHSGPSYWLF